MGRSTTGVDATNAAEEMRGNPPTATDALKPAANNTGKELQKTPSEDTDGSARLDVDLSTLEVGPSFTITATKIGKDTNTTTTLLHSRAANIPQAPVSTTSAQQQQQPFRFGQTPQRTFSPSHYHLIPALPYLLRSPPLVLQFQIARSAQGQLQTTKQGANIQTRLEYRLKHTSNRHPLPPRLQPLKRRPAPTATSSRQPAFGPSCTTECFIRPGQLPTSKSTHPELPRIHL